jgi:hypothetical protein
MGAGRLITALGDRRKVLQVFQQSLVVFDGQQDSDFMSKV